MPPFFHGEWTATWGGMGVSSRIRINELPMSASTQNKLLSFSEARLAVEQYAANLAPTDPELTGLLDAVGLALAEDLRADRDFPPFPRTTRDGYAVRAADVRNVPAELQCVGSIKAGAAIVADLRKSQRERALAKAQKAAADAQAELRSLLAS